MSTPPITRRTATLTLAALAFAAPTWAQPDFSKYEIATQKLTDTLYMLNGPGGNVGLSVGDDAVFVIDDQYAPMAPKLKAAIASITPRPVQFVLNTHFHLDHTGGNEAFGAAGALIVAHDNVRRRMSGEQLVSFVGEQQKASPKTALPVVTLPAEITFHLNGEQINAFHVPRAHTDGDLIVHFRKSDVVHMGDVFFNGMYPYIDVASGGSAEGTLAAVDRVLALAGDKTRIIPGHGPLSNKAELQAWRTMLATVMQRIKTQRASGKSDAEIRTARPTAEFDPRYGGGFIKLDIVVQTLLDLLPK